MMKVLILLFCLLPVYAFSAEKKALAFSDAMKFRNMSSCEISKDGKWLFYNSTPDRGDGEFVFQSLQGDTKHAVPRASGVQLSDNSKFAAMKVAPKDMENLNAKKDKPNNAMTILNLQNGEKDEIADVKSFRISSDGNWVAYVPKGESKKDKDKKETGEKTILRHLDSKTEIALENVKEFVFDSLATKIFYSVSESSGKKDGLYYRDLKKAFAPEYAIAKDSSALFSNLTWHERTNRLAYLMADVDGKQKARDGNLYVWNYGNADTKLLLKDSTQAGWYLPLVNTLKWTEDGQRLFFGLKPYSERPVEKDTTDFTDSSYYDYARIRADAELYMWHWNDPEIVTRQVKEWSETKDRTYQTVFDMQSNKYILLADTAVEEVQFTENPDYAVGYAHKPYYKSFTWYGPQFDLYSVDLKTGKKTLIIRKGEESASLSPDGRYIAYFIDKHWHLWDNKSAVSKPLTQGMNVAFYDEEEDTPKNPSSYGRTYWLSEDISGAADHPALSRTGPLLYDKYDIWYFPVDNGHIEPARNITKSEGRKNNNVLRMQNVVRNRKNYSLADTLTYISSFNKKNKEGGIYTFNFRDNTLKNALAGKKTFDLVMKAEYADKLVTRKESFEEFPDAWVSAADFSGLRKVTEFGAQTEPFIWGTNELIEWVSPNGDTLQGVLMKPDNYKAGKKYPVLIYFYEQFSDRMYDWSQPVNNTRPLFQMYLGSGYMVFLPDIKYKTGYPGKSSLDALLSGSQKLIDMGYADKDKFCLQGHSWAGYQSAWIVTQTDFFKACVSGAPVGNMTSAYSGIRLESGLARQFQYEAGQSRIGGNIIDSLDRYVENSPVFHMNKMNTPLLIMFGDVDDAVPWQQGVEIYLAARRFDKPCIFLQYYNEPHHLKKYYNKLDYSIRMKEFFDHYVLGTPAPKWITEGLRYSGDYMR